MLSNCKARQQESEPSIASLRPRKQGETTRLQRQKRAAWFRLWPETAAYRAAFHDRQTRDDILQALDQVIDPVSGRSVVQQNMIAGLVLKDGHVGFALEVPPARGSAAEPLSAGMRSRGAGAAGRPVGDGGPAPRIRGLATCAQWQCRPARLRHAPPARSTAA